MEDEEARYAAAKRNFVRTVSSDFGGLHSPSPDVVHDQPRRFGRFGCADADADNSKRTTTIRSRGGKEEEKSKSKREEDESNQSPAHHHPQHAQHARWQEWAQLWAETRGANERERRVLLLWAQRVISARYPLDTTASPC